MKVETRRMHLLLALFHSKNAGFAMVQQQGHPPNVHICGMDDALLVDVEMYY